MKHRRGIAILSVVFACLTIVVHRASAQYCGNYQFQITYNCPGGCAASGAAVSSTCDAGCYTCDCVTWSSYTEACCGGTITVNQAGSVCYSASPVANNSMPHAHAGGEGAMEESVDALPMLYIKDCNGDYHLYAMSDIEEVRGSDSWR